MFMYKTIKKAQFCVDLLTGNQYKYARDLYTKYNVDTKQ